MLKKLIPLLFWVSPCFAGYYAGFAVGPQYAFYHQKAHVLGRGPNAMSNFDVLATNQFSGVGVQGSVLGGYDMIFPRGYYLAAEADLNLSSAEYLLTNDELQRGNFAKSYFTIGSSLGLSVLPGFALTPTTLLYGRLGYANGGLKIVEGADPSIQNGNQRVSGISYGFGIRHALQPSWILMIDCRQINYQAFKSYTADAQVEKYTQIQPNTAQVMVGLLYHWV